MREGGVGGGACHPMRRQCGGRAASLGAARPGARRRRHPRRPARPQWGDAGECLAASGTVPRLASRAAGRGATEANGDAVAVGARLTAGV